MSITMSVYLYGGKWAFFLGLCDNSGKEWKIMSNQKAYLLLENGQIFEGKSFGVTGTTIGEVVFTTGMVGYQETLTDPSFYGQIAVQTFPLSGNYGTNSEDFESGQSWVKGYIVREWCEVPSNFRCEETIDTFLKSQNVIGLYGIDTRQLTRLLRENGVMNGMITTEDVYAKKDALLEQLKAYQITGAVEAVSVKTKETHTILDANYHVVLMDFGYKNAVLNHLQEIGCDVTIVPYHTSAEEILALHPDGVLVSNGPGNPEENVSAIVEIKKLVDAKVPMFGIALGHQLIALAQGGSVKKLKHGHRGANQPVKDTESGCVYSTSQNNGYTVDQIANGKLRFVNVNDGTCEGIEYQNGPVFTVQFYPEASGGPRDTSYLYGMFAALMDKEDK